VNLQQLSCFLFFIIVALTNPSWAHSETVQGKVTDLDGNPIIGATVSLDEIRLSDVTNEGGEYQLDNVPPGLYILKVTAESYATQTATIQVQYGQMEHQDFILRLDVQTLEEIVVTGSITPEKKIESSTSISTLNTEEMNDAAPRSTTEFLRRIPGFTRVESSGGEVNQNLNVRGLLGFASVNFQEDGMMVYPSMETFWMNADNLIRLDENIEKIEVLRGGTSPIFGSSTAGATLNFINKTGGDELDGIWRLSSGTSGLARFDFNINGPFSDDWRFSAGGFYRYDHGVRDPGYTGTKGGQLKANVTRLLSNGFFRVSIKHIDDRNLFIIPLPFQNPNDPDFVPGFSDTGSYYSPEGITEIPLPTGDELHLPLDEGIHTKGTWLTGHVNFTFGDSWQFEDVAQVMSVDHNWNGLPSAGPITAANEFAQSMLNNYIRLGIVPESTTYKLLFTNHFDLAGNKLPFDTANGLLRPAALIHVEKPISDFSNLLTITKSFGSHHFSFGTHFAYYTQTNTWYIPEVLTDIRDNPRFVDLVFIQPDGSILDVTKNGFLHFNLDYVNGDGNNTLIALFTSDEFKLTDRLRIDLGLRYERANYFQVAENIESIDLDQNPNTKYDIETWGNNTFRRFEFDIDDIAFSTGINYQINRDKLAVYGSFTRGFKMPALDEFIFEPNEEFINLFEPYHTNMFEAGVKYSSPTLAFSGAFYYGRVYNQILRDFDPTKNPSFFSVPLPDSTSWGFEFEILTRPMNKIELRSTTTLVSVETPEDNLTAGQFYDGFTPAVFDFETLYSINRNIKAIFDWHYVGTRFADINFTRRIPDFSYINIGASYQFENPGFTLTGRILNLTQSNGLEELFFPPDPSRNFFVARPILPRRVTAEVRYDF
jgi:iron complex outermembrane receptor protein